MDNGEEARRMLTHGELWRIGDVEDAGDDNTDPKTSQVLLAAHAIGYALLDVAAAIREQTEALHLGGIRDDLGNIGHAPGKLGEQ